MTTLVTHTWWMAGRRLKVLIQPAHVDSSGFDA